jgi:glucose/arabinose dehydrogenase
MKVRIVVFVCAALLLAMVFPVTGQDTTPTPTPQIAPTPTPQPPPPPAEEPVQNSLEGNALITATRPLTDELVSSLQLPEGFEVSVFARDLGNVRMMAVAPDGTIFVTRREEGDVIALFDADANGIADVEEPRVVASDLPLAHGITIHENRVYLATDTEIYVADLTEGGFSEPQMIIDNLPDGGQHPNRTLAFGPDGLMYVTVGSTCNACDESNHENATILQVQPDGSSRVVFSQGLRNTIGFGWHPQTGELWGMDHGTDWRGDNNPPEELNRLVQDTHYGWPFCYSTQQPDVYLPANPPGQTKEQFCPTTAAPVLEYQAHSAPIGMVFYTANQFPADYQNDALIAMRGSWNRNPAVGYEIVRLDFDENGQPVGFEPFLTGFLIEDGQAHFARPTGLVIAPDGSLLLSDDTNGTIYRISYGNAEMMATEEVSS